MSKRVDVLFVCIHNSARSQMAEAFLRVHGGGRYNAFSAGIEPGRLNPYVVRAMAEIGIDISPNTTKDVFQFLKEGRHFPYVITVCDETAAERCPIFPGVSTRLHWGFPDPSAFSGDDASIMAQTREVRDAIEKRVKEFVGEG